MKNFLECIATVIVSAIISTICFFVLDNLCVYTEAVSHLIAIAVFAFSMFDISDRLAIREYEKEFKEMDEEKNVDNE